MTKKAVTGGDLLAALIEAEDALAEMLATAAGLKDEAKYEAFESLRSSIQYMVAYGAVVTDDLHGPARMAKLAEIVEEFMRDKLPGLKGDAAARAFDNLAPVTDMLQ